MWCFVVVTAPSVAEARCETPDYPRPVTPPPSVPNLRECTTPDYPRKPTPDPSIGDPADETPLNTPPPTPPPSVAEWRNETPLGTPPPTPEPSLGEARAESPLNTPPKTPEPSVAEATISTPTSDPPQSNLYCHLHIFIYYIARVKFWDYNWNFLSDGWLFQYDICYITCLIWAGQIICQQLMVEFFIYYC